MSNRVIVLLVMLCCAGQSHAQLPVCTDTGGILYIIDYTDSVIYNFDPAQPVSATNPSPNAIAVPLPPLGLAVSYNINAAAPSPTFYTTLDGFYAYYDGSNWVNTGHMASTPNIGAGGGYIYGIAPGSNTNGTPTEVYRYDGTGDDTLILTIPGSAFALYDIIADCTGNFYVLNTGWFVNSPEQWMRKYSPAGVLLHQWYLSGVPLEAGGGGFAIIDNTVFFDKIEFNPIMCSIYKGVVTGDTIYFNILDTIPQLPSDMANCPKPLFSTGTDTVFYCGDSGIVTAQGVAPYTYTVVNGAPVISGAGPAFNVTSQGVTTIVLQSRASVCGNSKVNDTFIVVPPPVVNAGQDDTLLGCGTFIDTLQGSLTGITPWVNYSEQWTPMGGIVSGGNTLQPIIAPNSNTDYVLIISTGQGQGGCNVKDTVKIAVKDRSVYPDFSFTVHYGCAADTVVFTAAPVPGAVYFWDFGDGGYDTAANPTHIYPVQGVYTVMLQMGNNLCSGNIALPVNTLHPLTAAFSVSSDTICVNSAVSFTNTSMVTSNPAGFLWNFGDGNSDTDENVSHLYLHPGVYTAELIVTDFVPCNDTASKIIIVDTLSLTGFLTDKDSICTGQSISFFPQVDSTAQSLNWQLGDETSFTTINEPIQHAYDKEGRMTVQFNSHFRACPDASYTDTIYVYPMPLVNLGPDSGLCLNGAPIFLQNLKPAPQGLYHNIWNTGDTSASIKVVHPGTFSLTVRAEPLGCSTTETITVNKDCYIDIPNTFTPNGDGVNDYFFPRQLLSQGVMTFTMQVFNRWGQIVFETINPDGRGWDGRFNGRDQPEGVYIYMISVVLKNGPVEKYNGNVTLLR